MAKTLDDIFDDDDFGLLNSKDKHSNIKTDENRLIDSFEEINTFYEKNNREPSTTSMSEYNLMARLKDFRLNDSKKKTLKPFDRFNLLGHVEMEKKSLDEILEEDDLGLLNSDGDLSIFEFKHTPQQQKRAETDFVAQRRPMSDDEFKKYDSLFMQVHKDLKAGKRKFKDFDKSENNLQVDNFYLLNGLLLYLESAELEQRLRGVNTGGRVQLDGRTVTIFENGTMSNMNFRSLGKALQKEGKLITKTDESVFENLIENANGLSVDDTQDGWIYVLKSKSTNPEISAIKDLYKIGFSTLPVETRIKNASKQGTYLFADVEVVATFRCYNLNTHNFENLLHRFFGESCLNIDININNAQRITPREWFVVPIQVINEAVELLLAGSIIHYRYDLIGKTIKLK